MNQLFCITFWKYIVFNTGVLGHIYIRNDIFSSTFLYTANIKYTSIYEQGKDFYTCISSTTMN